MASGDDPVVSAKLAYGLGDPTWRVTAITESGGIWHAQLSSLEAVIPWLQERGLVVDTINARKRAAQ